MRHELDAEATTEEFDPQAQRFSRILILQLSSKQSSLWCNPLQRNHR